MTLHWVSVSLTDGRIIAELPDLEPTSTLKSTIGQYDTATVQLPIPTAPDDWQRATLQGYAGLLLLDTDLFGGDYCLWGGLVTRRTRQRGGADDYTSLSLATAESYFDRRYTPDLTFTGVDQNTIALSLVTYAGPAYAGLPFNIDTAASATTRTRTYTDMDDVTIYSALTALSGVIGGPEWTVQWRYVPSPSRWLPYFVVRDRLGASPPAGLGPAAEFNMPGSVTSITTTEDYSTGSGANDVMAYGSSQLDVRPQSPHQYATADGRPRFEYRWSPSTSIVEVPTLTDHALRALAVLAPGSSVVSLTAQVSAAPKLNVDWQLGDDVRYEAVDPTWPDGLSGVGRAIGWELDVTPGAETVTPVLLVPTLGGTP